MKSNPYAHNIIGMFLLVLISFGVAPLSARGEVQEETLSVLGGAESETISTGRFSRLVSRSAENITIVTASEIEGLNAHTLADILSTIPGIQLENQSGPASGATIHLQGSDFSHVLVLLDGVPINNLADNFSDVGIIPAQIIDRIEVVKGAASSSWGQALGGVINVITKSPDLDRKGGGAVAFSHGERGTEDARAEVSGTLDRFGYYLAGGYFGSGGFHPNTNAEFGHGYGKLTYDLPSHWKGAFTAFYTDGRRGEFSFAPFDAEAKDSVRRLMLTLSLSKPITERIDFELSAHHSNNNGNIDTSTISTGTMLQTVKDDEHMTGGSAKMLWHGIDNIMVLGTDYDHVRLRQNDALNQVDILNREADRFGFYLNDTYTLGTFSLSPGIRYDITGTSGDQVSPSFGATWQVGEQTTIRGYTAKGFSLPSLSLDRGAEKVWTTQLGAETSFVPYLWLKGTLFRNDVWDITVFDSQSGQFLLERQIRQGVETEAKTTPFFNTSLSVGYTFVDARKSSDDSIVQDVARHTLLLGLHYDDGSLLRAVINGRHIDWNAAAFHNGSYAGFVWDAHLTATPFGRGDKVPEFFFSVHNAFDRAQYLDEIYKNPGRWVEGGARFRF
jgi:vitamin B12 transporter